MAAAVAVMLAAVARVVAHAAAAVPAAVRAVAPSTAKKAKEPTKGVLLGWHNVSSSSSNITTPLVRSTLYKQ